jgi:hypothetical protein
MMGLLKGNGSHQKHNHTKDLQQLSLIIIAGLNCSAFSGAADWPCQTFNATFGLSGFARTTTLIYSQGFF